MRLFGWLLSFIYVIGFIAQGIALLYVEWRYLSLNGWLSIIDPMLQLRVLWATVTWPIYWLCLATTIVGILGSALLTLTMEKKEKKRTV